MSHFPLFALDHLELLLGTWGLQTAGQASLTSSSEEAPPLWASFVTWTDCMELPIILEKVLLCLCHHLPGRAIYWLRARSGEATAAATAQHLENSLRAKSSSPGRVGTVFKTFVLWGFFFVCFLIKKYHSHLPLPQQIPYRLSNLSNWSTCSTTRTSPASYLSKMPDESVSVGVDLVQTSLDQVRVHWTSHCDLWAVTLSQLQSHPSLTLTQSQAKHMKVSPDTCSSCCWGDPV